MVVDVLTCHYSFGRVALLTAKYIVGTGTDLSWALNSILPIYIMEHENVIFSFLFIICQILLFYWIITFWSSTTYSKIIILCLEMCCGWELKHGNYTNAIAKTKSIWIHYINTSFWARLRRVDSAPIGLRLMIHSL